MRFELHLSTPTLNELLRQFTPIRIHLGPPDRGARWVELDSPKSIEMVKGQGIRADTTGRIRYTLAGVRFPFEIRHTRVLLSPKIVNLEESGPAIDFTLEIEEGDLARVPNSIDGMIVKRVNEVVTPETTAMRWTYAETISTDFELHERLEPLDRLLVNAKDAEVEVDERGVTFAVNVHTTLTRHDRIGANTEDPE